MKLKTLFGACVAVLASASVAHADCLRLGSSSTGALSTESATLYNDCPVPVTFQYCVTSSNGGGAFSCAAGHFGYGSVGANGTTYLSVMGAGMPATAYWGSCEADSASGQAPLASQPSWNGAEVSVTCN